MTTISLLGCGWLGLPLGKHLTEKGYTVKGSTTSTEKLKLIEQAGIHPFLISVEDTINGAVDTFFQSEILILNIPPRRGQEGVEERYPHQVKLIAEAAKSAGVKKILFVSSTGVYAANNQWVTADDKVNPQTASAKGIVAAENYLRKQEQFEVTILRLAGLVGGDRNPGKWFAGKKNLSGGDVPVNLVHREDCIAAITAILAQGKWKEVYQLCADEHPLKKEYYPLMAKRLGLEAPEFSGKPIVPFKIIGNRKIKEALNLTLKFPNPKDF